MLRPPAFRLATPADDADLRALLRAIPMPGAVRLSYEREPSFFAADAASANSQTLVAREPSGQAMALVSRSTRSVFVNGVPTLVGYLGGLRVRPGWRTGRLLADGWTALRALHDADPVPFTLLAVTAENARARRLLLLHRGDAPTVTPVSDLVTLALVVHRRHRPLAARPGAADALRQRRGPRRDLFPAGPLALPGLGDEIVVTREGEAVAAATLWDARAVRQSVVRGYDGALGRLRPVVNGLARLAGAAPLPPVGAVLRSAFLVRPVAQDAETFDALLEAALRVARARGLAYVLVGFDARDPWLAHARRRPHLTYRSTLYAAWWPDGAPPDLSAPVHVEIASL